jgi:hypothetical protein
MERTRWLDRDREPSEAEIEAALGEAAPAWAELLRYLAAAYALEPEVVFGGRNYGWALRYRKGGRPLCTLYPEQGGFTALVVLGAAEVAKALTLEETLSPGAWACLANATQYHDGRWLWLGLPDGATVADVRQLLATKRRPKTDLGS